MAADYGPARSGEPVCASNARSQRLAPGKISPAPPPSRRCRQRSRPPAVSLRTVPAMTAGASRIDPSANPPGQTTYPHPATGRRLSAAEGMARNPHDGITTGESWLPRCGRWSVISRSEPRHPGWPPDQAANFLLPDWYRWLHHESIGPAAMPAASLLSDYGIRLVQWRNQQHASDNAEFRITLHPVGAWGKSG